jgi:hypothetical protein
MAQMLTKHNAAPFPRARLNANLSATTRARLIHQDLPTMTGQQNLPPE